MEETVKTFKSSEERWNKNADEYLATLDSLLNEILEPLDDKIKDGIKGIIHSAYIGAQMKESYHAMCNAEKFCEDNQRNMDYINLEGDLYSADFISDIMLEIINKLVMEIQDYSEKAMSTCMDTCKNLAYALFGLNAEVGEINDKIAKAIRKGLIRIDDNDIVFTQKMTDAEIGRFLHELWKEIGDAQWFINLTSIITGSSLGSVMQDNIKKLADRHQRGVIDGNGDNR